MKQPEKDSSALSDNNSGQDDLAQMSIKFNLVVDALKENKDVFISKILIKWIDYKFDDFLSVDHKDNHEEDKNEQELVDLDKHLLGKFALSFLLSRVDIMLFYI